MRFLTRWPAEGYMPLWTKEKGQGSEVSKERANLQVAEGEQNTHGKLVFLREPRNSKTDAI